MGEQTVLLTGGAGYIGSHVALDLVNEGYEVIILDDLSRGFAQAVNCNTMQAKGLVEMMNKPYRLVLHFGVPHRTESLRNHCGITRKSVSRQRDACGIPV